MVIKSTDTVFKLCLEHYKWYKNFADNYACLFKKCL